MNPEVAGGRVDAAPDRPRSGPGWRARTRCVDVADGDGAALGDFHESGELVDVELGVGLLVEVEGDGAEAHLSRSSKIG
jgi:hypothetical protein